MGVGGAMALVLVLPAVGLAAAVLGWIGLRSVGRSGGMVVGRPLAMAGLFLGLISAVIQGSVVLGALRTVQDVRNTLVPHADRFVRDVQRGAMGEARDQLSVGANSALTDEALALFARRMEEAGGVFAGADLRIVTMLNMAAEFRKRAAETAQRTGDSVALGADARPVQLEFASGTALAYFFLDEDALGQREVKFTDALVLMPGDGGAVVLLAQGPASRLARAIGIVVEGDGNGDGEGGTAGESGPDS